MAHAKRRIALRYWLQGKNFHRALRAMDFVERRYEGNFRKDGVTPEFDHVVCIASNVRTLPDLLYPEDTILAALGHDLGEPPYDMARVEIEPIFGTLASDAIELMTKKHRGAVKDLKALTAAMALDPISSIVKPVDRNHNLSTMSGVFKLDKQERYVDEVDDLFLPALKTARRRIPEQEAAYENITLNMRNMRDITRASIKALREKTAEA